jgi:hypothetical protein
MASRSVCGASLRATGGPAAPTVFLRREPTFAVSSQVPEKGGGSGEFPPPTFP